MPLMPKRVKYRKTQRGSRKGTASRNLRIDFGEFGLQTLERAWITNTQIEAARVALTRSMKRKGKLWIRIFPDKSVTARPPETRTGKGKGQPEYWVATVKPGNILFELDGVPESVARESLRLAADKPVVRTVTRVPHAKFGKIVKQMKKFYAHDEENKAKPGDKVRIMETRPMSKLKRWRLVEVVQK